MSKEQTVEEWKELLARRGIPEAQREELEDHLLTGAEELQKQGLSREEALLVSFRRLGSLNGLGSEYSRVHAGRLWRKLGAASPEGSSFGGYRTAAVLILLQFVLSQVPRMFGILFDENSSFSFLVNLQLLAFAVLILYFFLRRRAAWRVLIPYGLLLAASAAAVNVSALFSGQFGSQLEVLTAIHLPLLLWLTLLPLYTGTDECTSAARQLDFIRFTGEAFIYGFLLLCGIGVTAAAVESLFSSIGFAVEEEMARMLITGFIPLVPLAASVLVEAKGHLIENFAPVLARIFLPLFLLVMTVFLLTSWITGRGMDGERELLIVIDLLLALVLAMVLFTASIERDETKSSRWDGMILLSCAAAVAVDAAALAAVIARFSRYGVTPNRLAALGENGLLLINLGALMLLFALFLGGRIRRNLILRIQGILLVPYALWFLVAALGFPLFFRG